MNSKALLLPALVLGLHSLAAAQDPVLTVGDRSFGSWAEYLTSPTFQRCATSSRPGGPSVYGAQSDCSLFSTTISPEYDPGDELVIPVVFHVIQRTNGQGFVPQSRIQDQVEILNEDFAALAGSPGAGGTFAGIRFELATVDPVGNPTSGITYSTNNTWFNDGGSYWNQLAWDPDRYMNVYTNSASGALGYVPNLPQGGIVGSNGDRVVVLWSTVGRNAPIGPPFDQGRTLTHEVGHYLGLEHTFSGGCGSLSGCYTSGDLICDTARQSAPNFGCPGNASSCGSADPITNYMNYTDDVCMGEFTPEQINRMRCTLMNWRPLLASPADGPGVRYCASTPNSTGAAAVLTVTGSTSFSGSGLTLRAEPLPANQFGVFFHGLDQVQVPFGNGFRCTAGDVVRLGIRTTGASGVLELSAAPSALAGVGVNTTRNFQAWFRDPAGAPGSFDLSDAVQLSFVP